MRDYVEFTCDSDIEGIMGLYADRGQRGARELRAVCLRDAHGQSDRGWRSHSE